MDARTRICSWIILLGLANFVAYTIGYVQIGGDALNGDVRQDEEGRLHYFIHLRPGSERQEVSAGVWLYSAVHSISVWPTMGAVLLAMLTLAKDRIVSSLRSSIFRGRTYLTVVATLIVFITLVMTTWFVVLTARFLTAPEAL